MKKILVIALLSLGGYANAQTSTLLVHVKNLKNSNGTVHITLEDANRKKVQQKNVVIAKNTAQIIFTDLSDGQYAVNLFHDENNNNKLDTGVFGMPIESWGVSNDAKGRFGPPKFKDMIFRLEGNSKISITVN